MSLFERPGALVESKTWCKQLSQKTGRLILLAVAALLGSEWDGFRMVEPVEQMVLDEMVDVSREDAWFRESWRALLSWDSH